MPPRPPTSPPTRPPSPTNSPTTSQQPGACACDNHTIKDPNCLNCANDPFGCLGCKACGVEDCRLSPSSQFFSGFVGSGNTLKSPVEVPIHNLSNTSALHRQISLNQFLRNFSLQKFNLYLSQWLLWEHTSTSPMGTTCLCLVPCHRW